MFLDSHNDSSIKVTKVMSMLESPQNLAIVNLSTTISFHICTELNTIKFGVDKIIFFGSNCPILDKNIPLWQLNEFIAKHNKIRTVIALLFSN